MKKVARQEIKTRQEYEAARDAFRRSVMAQKDARRIHLGSHLTFLFENHDTVLYQIQEMMRAERIDGEAEIAHEIDTYNELLGERGELGCTLLVEIEDKDKRPELLAQWSGLPQSIYLKTQSGQTVPARFDPNQVGDRRISSVQYLKFAVGDQVPERLGCSHPDLRMEVPLTPAQSAALCEDLLSR